MFKLRVPISVGAAAWAVAGSVLLAGCASTPLEAPPAASSATAPGAAGTAGPGARGQSSVAPVDAARAADTTAGPAGAPRLVYFDYDSATIRPEFQSVIDGHARYLGTHRERRLTVSGHTDERGGREYNLALGQQRAEAVRRALQLLGVQAAQIETVSFGEEKPVQDGHEESAWSRNRRAELIYR